ncbi:MAG: ferritin [Gammaproteobacteria bacterium]|nr:ferritin [Gammaproteobacteria bacterium]
MKTNKQLFNKLNEQINRELHASYLYLAMSAYFEDINFPGFAKWMRMQSKEEVGHAMKIYDYLIERGERVVLTQIKTPKTEWKSPLDAFKGALAHEEKVTALINNLMDLAIKFKDHAAVSFLQWYVTEQVEEEANATGIVERLKMVKENTPALLMFDNVLGKRGA